MALWPQQSQRRKLRMLSRFLLCGIAGFSLACKGPDVNTDSAWEPGMPQLGAHDIVFQRIPDRLSKVATQPLPINSGSTLVAAVGRGQLGAFEPPTMGVTGALFDRVGEVRAYDRWPTSGTALYTFVNMNDAQSSEVIGTSPPKDEMTLAVAEVRNGEVVDVSWSQEIVDLPRWKRWLFGAPSVTSGSVATKGPAMLLAVWWGDASGATSHTVSPSDGFEVIDSVLEAGRLVQCAVAVRYVKEPGTYDVTWTASPAQGAQLWLIALEARNAPDSSR